MRSVYEKNQNQAKHDQTTTYPRMDSVINRVSDSAKRRVGDNHNSAKIINEERKKLSIIDSRDQVKIEAQAEDRNAIKTPR